MQVKSIEEEQVRIQKQDSYKSRTRRSIREKGTLLYEESFNKMNIFLPSSTEIVNIYITSNPDIIQVFTKKHDDDIIMLIGWNLKEMREE